MFRFALIFPMLLCLGCGAMNSKQSPLQNHPFDLVPVQPSGGSINFKVTDLDRKPFILADFRGKVVLLNFWASWCAICLSELDSLERLNKVGLDRRIAVVGVVVDSPTADAKRIVREHELTYTNIIDRSNKLRDYFKAYGLPMTIVLNQRGQVVSFINPVSGKIQTQLVGARDWAEPSILASLARISDQ